MPENNQILSVEGQLVGMPLAGPESFSQQQLDYLKRALGVDETVLWSNDSGAVTFTASEVITNFERIAVYVTDNPSSGSIQRVEIPMMGGNLTAPKFSLVSQWDSSWKVLMWWVKLTSSDMKSFSISSAAYAGATANSSWSNGNEPNFFRFYKIVGIHRISGGN